MKVIPIYWERCGLKIGLDKGVFGKDPTVQIDFNGGRSVIEKIVLRSDGMGL
jgi:hypothetical protein